MSKPFEVDMKKKIRKLKTNIRNEFPISNIDVDILIREFEKREKMIDLMAEELTSPIHNKKWVIEHYEKEAMQWKKMKKK